MIAVNYGPQNILLNNLKEIVDPFDRLEKVKKIGSRLLNGFLLDQLGLDFIVKESNLKSGRFVFFVKEDFLEEENNPKVFHLISSVIQVKHL